MVISAHARKVLWGLARNSCARCQSALVERPLAEGDPHALVGHECHIVARSPGGPRGRAEECDDVDAPDNLVLLCARCHALVDAQPERFPPEELRRLKAGHEARAAARGFPGLPELRLLGRDEPLRVRRMDNGDRLAELIGGTCSFSYQQPDGLSPAQRELVGLLLQSCSDWGDIWNAIGPKGQLDAGQYLQHEIDELQAHELVIYAARRTLALTGDGAESPWPEAVVQILHARDARVPTPAAA